MCFYDGMDDGDKTGLVESAWLSGSTPIRRSLSVYKKKLSDLYRTLLLGNLM